MTSGRQPATTKSLMLALLVSAMTIGSALADGARKSDGCGQAFVAPPELLAVDGAPRQSIIVIPERYEPDEPHSLVFGFHGRTNNNARARRYFGLEGASRRPTIYVYPAGLVDDSGRFTWWELGDRAGELRDFRFFDELLGRLASSYCIDQDSIHVVGHSLGASFANSLACARGAVIRSVVSVAGGVNPTDCTGAAAAMLLHNPRDELVPISEGERARAVLLGADADDRGGGDLDQIGAFTCQRYRDGENPVLWCPHRRDRTSRGRYYPHQWPEGVGEAVSLFIEELSGESMAADAAPGLAEAHSIPDEWLAERTSGHDEADVIGTERCASGSSFLTNATPSVAPQGVARRACLTRP